MLLVRSEPPELSHTETGAPLNFTENTGASDFEWRPGAILALVRMGDRSIEKLLAFSTALKFLGARSGLAWAVIPDAANANAAVNSIRRVIVMRKRSRWDWDKRPRNIQQLLYL
jgi:hypothetical protein